MCGLYHPFNRRKNLTHRLSSAFKPREMSISGTENLILKRYEMQYCFEQHTEHQLTQNTLQKEQHATELAVKLSVQIPCPRQHKTSLNLSALRTQSSVNLPIKLDHLALLGYFIKIHLQQQSIKFRHRDQLLWYAISFINYDVLNVVLDQFLILGALIVVLNQFYNMEPTYCDTRSSSYIGTHLLRQ